MSISPKIQAQHLTRQAIVYVRQSTPQQVQRHQESTRRQYQLKERAHEWGWSQASIQVIDDDLGMSGTSSTQRVGFQRLVTAISLGEVGVVLVTEVSRLSRLNSDWHRVIELCAVFESLIADEDGLYDPRDPNDGLLLGLKGTLFAAELQILRARMRKNLLNKAQRGELRLRLPVGYRRLEDGTVILEPDEQVQDTLHTLFDQFRLLKSGRAVQRYFQDQQLDMPRRIQHGIERGQIHWVTPTYQMIQRVLTSPVYAGTFVYGRTQTERLPGDPQRKRTRYLPMEEWKIVIPDVYPAYISYDHYLSNREILSDNVFNFQAKGRGAAREGGSLLQGRLICGRCGRRMTPSYGKYPAYVCRRAQMMYGDPQCQSFPMRYLDEAVAACFLEAVQPAKLDILLTALDWVEEERQSRERHWQQRLERARYQARLAQRQYDVVDPENRLVARVLEKRWNETLLELQQLEQDYTLAQRHELAPLNKDEQQAVRQLAHDLPALWQAETTTPKDRKCLLRLVVEEVTLTVAADKGSAESVILWSGQVTTQQHVTRPRMGWHCVTDADIVQCLRELAATQPDHRIAEILNAEGTRTQTGKTWTYQRVQSIRKQHAIPTSCPISAHHTTPRGDGLLRVKAAAQRLDISAQTVHLWAKQAILVSDQRVRGSKLWVRVDETDLRRLDGSMYCDHLPTIDDLIAQQQVTRAEVWQHVKAGQYVVYRVRKGGNWEWRLERQTGAMEP